MAILDKLFGNPRLFNRSAPDASAQPGSVGRAQADPPADAPLPFAGYDDLNHRQVIEGLSDHSQIELEAVESYERCHENRELVLNKLRYMRGPEPLPGYDALGVEEIMSALKEADLATLKKVRDYERKFAHRPDVVEEAVRAHKELRATQPASTAPGYQPMSATSA
jgi:hypothetical protein